MQRHALGTAPFQLRAELLLLFLFLCLVAVRASSSWQPPSVSSGAAAPLRLHNTMSSNMVLQRAPHRAVMWGQGEPGRTVTITVDAQHKVSAAVDGGGYWRAELLPQPPVFNTTVTVTDGFSTVTLLNVAFGDVFFCSGQSNMQVTLSHAAPAQLLLLHAGRDVTLNFSFGGAEMIARYREYGSIRLCNIPSQTSTTGALNESVLSYSPDSWTLPSPSTLAASPSDIVEFFSAVCFYSAAHLADAIKHSVPIGLVQGSVGGTLSTAWTSPDTNLRCGPIIVQPGFNQTYNQPSALYYSMIHPLLPMRFAAVLWYQAESDILQPERYGCSFPNLISDWRQKFNAPVMPFFFVLLPGYISVSDYQLADIRHSQLQALRLPHVAVANALDCGDAYGPIGDVHPRNKSYVGQRLSLLIRREIYGEDIVDRGPILANVRGLLREKNQVVLIAQFEGNIFNRGLMAMNTPNCSTVSVCCGQTADGAIMQLMDVSVLNTGVNATGCAAVIIDQQQRTVSCNLTVTGVANDVLRLQVSMAWKKYPGCLLYNDALLPVLPFLGNVSVTVDAAVS